MHKKSQNRVRLQAGKWRGRSIAFPDVEGVRPTKSMVKETLMSWLRPSITRMHCLDLFAGSGSLTFELASQGARSVVGLDKDPLVCRALIKAQEDLRADNVTVGRWEYPHLPSAYARGYDLVLLDPPFGLLAGDAMLNWVAETSLVAAGGVVYLELADNETWPVLPGWESRKHKKSGGVQFGLLVRVAE
jgi:16S rRNA (guanine966-N2)-methyltransferase